MPSEIDQNMHELRQMDDDLQKFREGYSKHKRSYLKQSKASEAINTPTLLTARLQLEKEFKTAMQKQDQKIDLAMKMYDLVSRHIERLDSQVITKSNLNKLDWIRKGPQRKRMDGSIRKRTHHSSRPNPLGTQPTSTGSSGEIDPNEPRYCYCHQVSFGDMIACDGENCEREWFHYPCVGLVEPPAGKWFCEECSKRAEYNSSGSSNGEEEEEGDLSS